MLEHYGVSSIRFDGDIKADARTAALKSFQNGGADVLLATVASGGTPQHYAGEPRHLPRSVVQSADARAGHRRTGASARRRPSTSPSGTRAHDRQECMAHINRLKLDNAEICLADGTSMGAVANNNIFKDLEGVIGAKLRRVA